MPFSTLQFPREELIEYLRKGEGGKRGFVKHIQKVSIEWIYEIIKHCENILHEMKENPETKLRALELTKDLIQSCQVPCINLFEIYILPIIYQVSCYSSKEQEYAKGCNFFQNNGYSARIPNVQETGIKFVRLCEELLLVCAKIKKSKSLFTEELSEESDFTKCYNEYLQKQKVGATLTSFEIQNFDHNFIRKGPEKYLKNLKDFQKEKHSESYSNFFVILMIDSLQTQQNPLFSNTGKTVSSISTDLDMRTLLKAGDPYINLPLVEEAVDGIVSSENFYVRKNFLSILSDFVKWANVESFVQVLYSDFLDDIIPRIVEVRGHISLNEGENIYPEIKGQKEAKKKFYIQLLKSVQIWAKCLIHDLEDADEKPKIQEIYEFLKIEKKFIFPQNIMTQKIIDEFHKCEQHNKERNQIVLAKMKQDETSLFNTTKRSSNRNSINRNSSFVNTKKNGLHDLNQRFQNVTDLLFTLCEDEKTTPGKMKALVKFRDEFESELESIGDEKIGNEFEELLENGDFINGKINEVEKIFIEYKIKKINFASFKEKYEKIVDSNTMNERSLSRGDKSLSRGDASLSQSVSRDRSFKKVMGESQDRVITSFNNTMGERETSFRPENNLISRISEEEREKEEKSLSISQREGKSQITEYIAQINQGISENAPNQSQDSQKKKSSFCQQFSSHKSKSIKGLNHSQNENILKEEESHPYYQNTEFVKKSKTMNLRGSQKSQLSQINSQSKSRFRRSSRSRGSNSKDSLKERISHHRQRRDNSNESCAKKLSQLSKKSSSKMNSSQNISQVSSRGRYNSPGILTQEIKIESQSYNAVPTNANLHRTELTRRCEVVNQEKSIKISEKERSGKMGKSESSLKEKTNRVLPSNSAISGLRENLSKTGTNINPFSNHYDYYEGSIDQYQKKSLKQWNLKANPGVYPESLKGELENNSKQYEVNSKFKFQEKDIEQFSILKPSERNFEGQKISREYSGRYEGLQTSIFEEEDQIVEPEAKPVENSYYGYNEIEAKVKGSSAVPDFKQCFELQKEVIPTEGRKEKFMMKTSQEKNKLFRRENSSESRHKKQSVCIGRTKQEQYLIRKLKKEQKREKDNDLRNTNSRLKKIRGESDSIKSLSSNHENSNRSKDQSISKPSFYNHTSKGLVSFTHSKNSSSQGNLSKVKSSKIESRVINGQILNDLPYLRYFEHIQDEKSKKSFLKQKALLLKNNFLEIGTLFHREQQKLKVTLYITPEENLESLTVSCSNETGLNVQVLPESFHSLSANKQIKSYMILQLENYLFNPPTIRVSFRAHRQVKHYEFYLPTPITKFLEFNPVKDYQGFLRQFEGMEENIIKTSWIRMSKRIGKIEKMLEYFPKLTRLGQEGEYTKYGAECSFENKNFLLAITTRSLNNIAIQGVSETNSLELMEFCLSSMQHFFSLGE